MKSKNKVVILTSIIVGVLVVTLGLTYAVLTFNETKGNSQLVLGDIWMHYGETNQLVLSDAMPIDIKDYTTYKVNPVMASQESNELSICVNYLSGLGYANELDSGSTMITYCQGNGTAYGGYTLQNDIDDNIFDEVQLQAMLSLNVIVANGDNYIVNPIMATQEVVDNKLSKCITIYIANSFDEGSTAESFCKGTGTANGLTFQELLDTIPSNEGYLNLLDAGVILQQIDNLPYFEFTIDGNNTYDKKDIWYEIVLNHGNNHETRQTRIRDDLLKFRLVEVNNNVETELLTNKSYASLENKRIYVDTIPANTNEEINRTYRLYMWISEDTVIGNVEEDYTIEEWNDVYASIKVNVTGDFNEKDLRENFVNLVKSKYGSDTALVAVNTDGDLYDGTGEIREYRYSGPVVNNYVFFDTDGDGEKDTNEIWRIIGVFKDTVKDEEGNIVNDTNGNPTYEEKVKLVRNTILQEDEMPTSYLINGTTYTIKTSGVYAYWNNKSDYNNDWTTAGLQYYLNTEQDENEISNLGYLSYLTNEVKEQISLTTYYLGNVQTDVDTVKNAYNQERGSIECASSVTSNAHSNNCNIWSRNRASWDGLIGLMYPSDYGYSASNAYWGTYMINWSSAGTDKVDVRDTSWLNFVDFRTYEWFLSPSSYYQDSAMGWNASGFVYEVSSNTNLGVRPTLYLKTNTLVVPGEGTELDPFVVVID